jgi:hypothetical protein
MNEILFAMVLAMFAGMFLVLGRNASRPRLIAIRVMNPGRNRDQKFPDHGSHRQPKKYLANCQ